jgi:ABC-type lipoprotein release transport system permease subunit
MKYILIGIIIGIIIGIVVFYLLMTFRIIQPFGLFGFGGNFSRTFPRGPTP